MCTSTLLTSRVSKDFPVYERQLFIWTALLFSEPLPISPSCLYNKGRVCGCFSDSGENINLSVYGAFYNYRRHHNKMHCSLSTWDKISEIKNLLNKCPKVAQGVKNKAVPNLF